MHGDHQRIAWGGYRPRFGGRLRHFLLGTLLVVLAGCGSPAQLASLGAASPAAQGSATAPAVATRAQITVTPSIELTAGETVRVAVSGFPAESKVFLSECAAATDVSAAGCGPQLAAQPFLLTDGDGAATGTFVVQPVAASQPNAGLSVKCRNECVLVATSGIPAGGGPHIATAPLAFGLPPTPAIPTAPPTIPPDAPFVVRQRITLPLPGGGPVDELISGGGWLYALACNPGCTVIRLDPRTGQVGPTTTVTGARALGYAEGQLWVARGTSAGDGQPPVAPALLALDPVTLAVRRTVALPEAPRGVAVAGRQLWVTGTGNIRAVDPRTGAITHDVPVTADGVSPDFLVIAASADGTALWTALGSGDGGPIPVQLRSPKDGHVLSATTDSVVGIAPTGIAAADDHAWLGYATGMLGAYVRVTLTGDRLTETPPQVGPPSPFANGIATHLAHGQLWITDAMSGAVACARDTTGKLLARTQPGVGVYVALAALDGGQLALAEGSQVLIVDPQPVCGT